MGATAAKLKILLPLYVLCVSRPLPIPRRNVLLDDFQRSFDCFRWDGHADLFGGL
jgi:hypothetical protein